MPEIILHHYTNSPFSEKIRLILGFKNISWRSVMIPPIMPKPDVVALTGGYRRTPFLQIGADIYCDSALIADVLEKVAPEPTLYPVALAARARIMARWADNSLFWAAIPSTFQPAGLAAIFHGLTQEQVKAFAADRAAMRAGARSAPLGETKTAMRIYLAEIESLLMNGGPWLLGNQATIADFSVYHCLWFIWRAGALGEVFNTLPHTLTWLNRMKAIGHSAYTPLSSTEAIALASTSQAESTDGLPWEDMYGLSLGAKVTVAPVDYAIDHVAGELVISTMNEIGVRRHDERAGNVVVHFPRLGYQINAI